MAITNAQQYKQLMNEGGPMRKIKGQDHMLAYITPNEADKLVKLGGQETMTPEGILAYPEYDNYGFSSQADFDSGDVSRSSDAKVRGDAPGQNRVTAQQLAATNAAEKKAPPKKPKKTKDNYKKSSQFTTPTLAAINFVGQGIKNSKLGRYLNTKQREDYLENLKEEDNELYQATVDDLAKLGYATRDVELYGPKGKRDGPMAPGRDIETFTDLYEDQAKSILNTVTDSPDGGVGTLYDDYLDEKMNRFTPDNDGGNQVMDPCKGPNPPAYCFIGANADENTEAQEDDEIINYRLMADGGRAGFAEGGMPYEGGIMDLESSRQMYGLGKLVKKITRGVKKIAKSPIGKAAIGAALFKFGGGKGIMGKLFGVAGRNQALLGTEGFLSKFGLTSGFGSYMPTALGGIAASTLGSYFMTPKEEDEDEELYAGADIADPRYIMNNPQLFTNRRLAAEGGSMDEPVAKKTMPLLDMDGQEMDLREEGGFVPLGRMEKADDVPARLSKNEFVFTADAVRNAGEGDVDKGAEVMYNMMKNLESGGEVSEESQGLEGARKMFQTSQRLEEVL